MNVLLLDGPLNGHRHDLEEVYCTCGQTWQLLLAHCTCGESTHFRAGGAVYSYERWTDDLSQPDEYVGIWVHNIQGPA